MADASTPGGPDDGVDGHVDHDDHVDHVGEPTPGADPAGTAREDEEPALPGGPLGRWVLHPLLVVAWPTLALWAGNVQEVPTEDALAVLWPTLVVGAVAWLVVSGVFAVLRRSEPVARAGLVVSVGAAVVLLSGRFLPGASATVGLAVSAAVVVGAVALAWLVRRLGLARLTLLANVFAVVATAGALVGLQPVLVPSRSDPVLVDFDGADAPARDIWYIIPDRYPRLETLADEYDFDNTPFQAHLEDLGFSIQDEARANYPKTSESLAATWNLDTVQDLVPTPPESGADPSPLYELLDDHALGRFVTDAGFDYVHLGSWWGPTADSSIATENRILSTATEFETVWRTTTALRWWGDQAEDEGLDSRRFIRDTTDYQLDELDRLVTEPSDVPRFVLAHVTLPHEPYVYDADGSYVSAEVEASRSRATNTVNQVEYVNSRLTSLVDRLVTGDPANDPIIVIQSDEGPHPDEQYAAAGDIKWLEVDDAARAEKLRTFSAWYLPGIDDDVPEDITGVNTWRFILDRYFGADLPLLEDRVWVFTDEEHLYDWTEVTDQFD